MRIGMVCPYSFDEPGGVQAHILDLANIFRTWGHEVAVLGPATDRADVPDFVVRGGGALAVPYNGSVARIAVGSHVVKTVRRFLSDGDFDVLHVHEPNAQSFSMAAVKYATGPIVATYHAAARNSFALKVGLPVLRPNLDKIQAGIAVSEVAHAWQSEQVGTNPIIIPNGVDVQTFARARANAAMDQAHAPKRAVDKGPEVLRLVFLGRSNEPRKGLDVLLRALQHVDPAPHLTVIGSGPPKEIENVEFVGKVSDAEKARLLAEADVFVAPNTGGESFGIVLVEAMASGCAVLASDLPAFRAVLDTDGRAAGEVFPVGDYRALAKKIALLAHDGQRRAALAEAGKRRAQRYDWPVVAEQIMTVYEAVSGSGKVGVER